MSNFSINLVFSSNEFFLKSSSSSLSTSFSLLLAFLSFMARLKSFLSITTPCIEGGAFSEASFTSPALSPNIALSSFSSGVGSLSPLGVILPIKISPSFTSAPILTNPFSSRSLVASLLTLGMSLVNSSCPRFVSLTSSVYSSIWIEVKISSLITFSEITIASSKL